MSDSNNSSSGGLTPVGGGLQPVGGVSPAAPASTPSTTPASTPKPASSSGGLAPVGGGMGTIGGGTPTPPASTPSEATPPATTPAAPAPYTPYTPPTYAPRSSTPAPPYTPPTYEPKATSSGSAAYTPPVPVMQGGSELTGGRIALGIVLGIVMGIIADAIWVAIITFTGFNLVYLAIGVGWLIGFAVYKGCGQGNGTPQVIGGIIAFVFTGGLFGLEVLGASVMHIHMTPWDYIFGILSTAFGTFQGFASPEKLEGAERS